MTLIDVLSFTHIPKRTFSFKEAIHASLREGSFPSQETFNEWVENYECYDPLSHREDIITHWKNFLCLSLFCHIAKLDSTCLEKKILSFEKRHVDETDQYIKVLIALNHILNGLPVPSVGVNLLESGAALIHLIDYCPWLSLPFTPKHFELGVFLSIYSLLCKEHSDELINGIRKMAHWQMNTLDCQCIPYSGVFVREVEGNPLHHLCMSYLLFRCASLFDHSSPFLYTSQSALAEIIKRSKREEIYVDTLWVLIDEWLRKQIVSPCHEVSLEGSVYDPSTALVGFRNVDQHVICTLHGVQTGLGTIKQEDVSIVTYGPHYLPFGDCTRFGIQGNAVTDRGVRRSQIDLRKNSFKIEGCVRLLDEPDDSCVLGKFRGIWLDVIQEFKDPIFSVKTTFLCLDKLDGVAFTFFVKASKAVINSRIFPKGKLERYEGVNTPIRFEGKTGSICLNALQYNGRIEIIPLAGEKHFWGADFLVAYFIEDSQKQIEWQIELQQVQKIPSEGQSMVAQQVNDATMTSEFIDRQESQKQIHRYTEKI